MAKILIVDDEEDIVELIAYNLEKEGFSILKAYDGQSAVKTVRDQKPDLVILDLMLPLMNGIDVCRNIRGNAATASIPIIMLTAKSDEIDKILGLEMGADDYITKPFSVRELIARIRALLRRSQDEAVSSVEEKFSWGELRIDYASYDVMINGKKINLTPTEMKLLFFFSRHPGRVYSREQLLNHVWNDDTFVTSRTVDVHIKRLRSQIENDVDNPKYILTVRGFGYKFAEIK
jgi:two-component system, OmpR family, alkaline phosphatase synthesis response regulator PhoP